MAPQRPFIRSLVWLVALLLGAQLCASCQSAAPPTAAAPTTVATVTPSPSLTATSTPTEDPAPSETPAPTETSTPTRSPSLTPLPTIHPDVVDRFLRPCYFLLHPVDADYSNPQANLDPQTGLTWMSFTITPGVLQADDLFRYWWDTRAFLGDLSFNKGDGFCEILIETNQILCEGIPLRGTDNLPTGGYEYDIKLFRQDATCLAPTYNYQQSGLIFMDTLVHDVYYVNGEDAP